jgi:hypothetical protein
LAIFLGETGMVKETKQRETETETETERDYSADVQKVLRTPSFY